MFDTDLHFRPEKLPGGRKADDYLLFFAVLPPPEVNQAASTMAQTLRATHGIAKPAMPPERLHVTVQPVCTFSETWPSHRLHQVLEIANELTPASPALQVRFDRAGSMGRRAPSALALKGDAATRRAMLELTGPLAKALARSGFDEFEQSGGAPHMTLVYATQLMADRPIPPLGWAVSQLVLLLSHRGCGHYQRLGSWPLRGAVTADLF